MHIYLQKFDVLFQDIKLHLSYYLNILIYELYHVLASWLCLRRFSRITQGDAVEQLVILGECHAVEIRLGRRRIQYPTGRTAQAAGTDAP